MRTGKPDLLQDPQVKYRSPERLIEDPALSDRAKRALLRHWKSDLTLLLIASEENMAPRSDDRAEAYEDQAELLQRVSNCLLRLDAAPRHAS